MKNGGPFHSCDEFPEGKWPSNLIYKFFVLNKPIDYRYITNKSHSEKPTWVTNLVVQTGVSSWLT